MASIDERRLKNNEKKFAAMAAPAPNFNLSFFVTSLSKRLLLTPITDSESLQTAIGAWCEDSAQATGTYGDISTWFVR